MKAAPQSTDFTANEDQQHAKRNYHRYGWHPERFLEKVTMLVFEAEILKWYCMIYAHWETMVLSL
jgi:hypothetical protein